MPMQCFNGSFLVMFIFREEKEACFVSVCVGILSDVFRDGVTQRKREAAGGFWALT